ncbi:MAG: hypothetical protein IJK86_08365 [Lachnospiraceae bacterium]|nr:hypothetical protein [Lachnospiraceae bacterium]
MRDHKLTRGLNPKKAPLLALAQYCAAADVAEEELQAQRTAVRDCLGAFLASLVWDEPAEAELSVSDLIYNGLPGVPPAHEEAQKTLQAAWDHILKEVAGASFARGFRAGFSRPRELAEHLRKDVKLPLDSPLEVLFPADLWALSLADLTDRYGDAADFVLSERDRYQKDREEAKARREAELKEKAAAVPYDGEPGKLYGRHNADELEDLKERYTREEIGLLHLAGKIRLAYSLQKFYRVGKDPGPDKAGYRLDFVPDYHCAVPRDRFKALTAAYEAEIRRDRDAALEEARAKNKERNERKRRNAAIRTAIVNSIPGNYIDFFPLARAMSRRFVLHIGPTNSGKTHDAIEALKTAENGIYLGPLRLLAFEQYEALNEAGCPCSLVTGEERLEVPGARYQASTVEMLNTEREYEVAVIDEAQMIGDPDRGGAWTRAVLGVCAAEVHVCAAPIAKNLLVRLIKDCGDTYEIVQHRRMTPLKVERAEFTLDSDVLPGDALIVFSKKSVHGVGAYLQQRGYRCSVVYGALPYDVRREQAKLFAGGDTDVVVATDAIGMGMNLPIRRIIFLEQEKFDGYEVRPLRTEEIKQIAGRAGRYGIYPEGLVNSPEGKPRIREALEIRSEAVKSAVIDFPESLLGVDAPLTEIIQRWIQIEIRPGYTRADPARMLKLCKMISDLSEDKRFLYDCISMTFDEEDEELLYVWRAMCAKEAAGAVFPVERSLPGEDEIRAQDNMNELEQSFRLCDLLYGYCEKFGHTEFRDEIMGRKNIISGQMTDILARQSLSGKKCPRCGRALPWNYPYRLCDPCFKRERNRFRK